MEFLDFPDMFKQINLIVISKTFMEPLMWLSLAIHYEDAPRFSGRLDSWLLLVVSPILTLDGSDPFYSPDTYTD